MLPIPAWNTGGLNNVDPGGTKQALGWVLNEQPASSSFNWWMKGIVDFLNDAIFNTIELNTVTIDGTLQANGLVQFFGQTIFESAAPTPPAFQKGASFADVVTTSKDNASPSAPNELTGRALHKVHATITLNTSTSPTVNAQDKWNVGTVSAAGGGTKTVTVPFATAFAASVTPAVTIQLSSLAGVPYVPATGAISNNSVTFQIYNLAGTAQDPTGAGLNGMVIGVIAEGKQ